MDYFHYKTATLSYNATLRFHNIRQNQQKVFFRILFCTPRMFHVTSLPCVVKALLIIV